MSHNNVKALMNALAAPFPEEALHFKPAVVTGNRALALAYVDARAIQDRLDTVLGVDGWSDDYEALADGSVVCRLRCKIGDEWVTKTDAGGPSEQPDGGDRLKAAFSDALKRAAVKFGVGRYLYRLPTQWVDYDPQKRQFRTPPRLPNSSSQTQARTITDEERQHLTELLVRKGRTPGAALKTVGCKGADLADLTADQYRELVARLEKLLDKQAAGKPTTAGNETAADGRA
jgi:hypothetical protein